jgi:hypothetical protein
VGYPMRATRAWSLSRLLNRAPTPETCGPTEYEYYCFGDQDSMFVPLTEDNEKNFVMGQVPPRSGGCRHGRCTPESGRVSGNAQVGGPGP